MDDEYISREAALKDFEASNAHNQYWTPPRGKTILICQPAADVAEVHHARWEEADWYEYDAQSGETIRFPKAAIVCSNCRNAFKKGTLWIQSFCPACDARMDGAAE